MVLHHVENRELLNSNHLIVFRIPLGRFIVIVTSLPRNLEMGLRCATGGFPATVTAFLAPQRLLRSAIEAGVLNRVPFTIRQERFEANINTDSRMSASEGRMFGLHVGLTHDQCIPMAVSPMNKMDGLRSSLDGTVQLDFERFPDLRRDVQVFVICIQPDITAGSILAQLDRMPAIGRLEAREPDISETQLFRRKKPFECFGESVSKHLHSRSWHRFTAPPFESGGQIVLRGEGPLLLILYLDRLKHLIVQEARLLQALYEQASLFLIRIQSKLKRSHLLILQMRETCVKYEGRCR